MKKFLGMFLSLMLSLSLFSSYTIFAQDNTKYLMKESSVQQYTTSTGNVCVKTGRNYACKYGLETDKPVED